MSDDYEGDFEGPEEKPRDRKVDEAKAELLVRYFPDGGHAVYYGRQLEIALEREFFHWITKKGVQTHLHGTCGQRIGCDQL